MSALNFEPIDPAFPNVLLHEPKRQRPRPSQVVGPKVIILATWLGGATAARIAVYCQRYQSLYPASAILLIRTVLADITIKSSATVQAQLQPARDYLDAAFSSHEPVHHNNVKDAALLHMFSQGAATPLYS